MLDLFAGSGALGFEAVSRGAASVVFVERARSVQALIRKNAEALGVSDRIRILGEDVTRALPKLEAFAPFDIVIADPPYADGWERKIFTLFPWNLVLRDGGTFCLEWGHQAFKKEDLPESLPCLVKVRQKIYGDSVLTTYQQTSNRGVQNEL